MKYEKFNNIISLDIVDSTNTYLKKYSKSLPAGTVVFAEDQTKGKGRLNRKWHSEKGKSITCSFLIKDIYDNIDAVRLTFLFSLAVKHALTKYIECRKITLKWPNDVLSSGKKICGILSEYSKECAIIGIGINVNNYTDQDIIGQPWTSVESECGHRSDIETLKNELVESVNETFARFCTNPIGDIPMIWFREAGIINITASVMSGSGILTGSVKSIDDKGILYIKDSKTDQIKSISFGDISYHDQF